MKWTKMKKIKFCNECKEYTLKDICSKCGNSAVQRTPPRFSPKDKYAKYRRVEKEKILKKEGLLWNL